MKKRRNRFLDGFEQELQLRYSKVFVQNTMKKAWARFRDLLLENRMEEKALKIHTTKRIYPAIASFEALLSMQTERETAIKILAEYFQKRSLKKGDSIRLILRIPRLYRWIPRLFARMTPKFFGESAGFQANFLEQSETAVKFDMLVCPYYETCKKYDCPELVAMFCDADDACYGKMHPKIQWLRTKTLGKGGDCCDFEVRIDDSDQ